MNWNNYKGKKRIGSMRVLIVLTVAFNPNDGGVQRTSFKLGKFFSEQGIIVAYYSTEKEGHISPEFGELYKSEQVGGTKCEENLVHLRAKLGEFKPDIVINQMPYERELTDVLANGKLELNFVLLGCLRNSLFSFKSNVREIAKQNFSSFFFYFLNNRLGLTLLNLNHRLKHRRMLKRIIDQHDRYILLAPPNREELEFFVGDYKKEKVLSIPNSIPDIIYCSPKKEKIILHVGRINVAQKRSDLLLDFWAETYQELFDWKFVIVGEGPYLEELKKDLQNRNLPRIEVKGYQKPEAYFEKATFFMMPSAYEGFPNTILEAQSYGVIPFAFSSYSAINWIVNSGKDSVLIEPYNTRLMAKKMIELAASSTMINQYQKASYENASRFTISKVGEQWLGLFNSLLYGDSKQ